MNTKKFKNQLNGHERDAHATLGVVDNFKQMKDTLRLKQEIIDYLVHFKLRIETNNRFGLYDVNKLSQEFIASLLNIAIKGSKNKYIDLDKLQNNYPAIDIGCKNQKIAYQITSQNDTSKIYDTILSFKEKHLDNGEFKIIRFIILNNLSWSAKQWQNIKDRYTSLGLVFDEKSIITIEQIDKNIGALEKEQLEQFLTELKKEFGKIEHQTNDNSIEIENEKARKELMSKLYHYHESPWEYAESEDELKFKRLLKNKDSISCELLAKGQYHEIIKLWEPLMEFDLYDINHPYWLDKPYFRRFIQSSKMDVCLAEAGLCAAITENCDLNQSITLLREILMAPTYSTTGGSKTQLPTEVAKHENNETILFLNRIIEIFRKLMEIWATFFTKQFKVDEFTIESLIEKCEFKIRLIESVNE